MARLPIRRHLWLAPIGRQQSSARPSDHLNAGRIREQKLLVSWPIHELPNVQQSNEDDERSELQRPELAAVGKRRGRIRSGLVLGERFHMMKNTVVVLALIAVWAGCTRAQTNSITSIETQSAAQAQRTGTTLPDSPFPKQIPGCPKCGESSFRDLSEVRNVVSPHHRVADKKFWLVAGAVAGSTLLHVLAVSHCRRTVGIENCEGGYGPYRAMQGLNIALSTVMAGVGYGWKKQDDDEGAKHSRWWVIPAGTAAFMGVTAIQQYRKHCPAGTHFDAFYCE